MNILKFWGVILSTYLIPFLFILGLITVNTALYIKYGLFIGLLTTGLTLIVVSIILSDERSKAQGGK
ncbi:hypothetical protein NDM77_001652 [Staphylococcus pseudintermedius]|nr:hypothetical protein [Staphylococcus pseudintermedius]EJL2084763.1 hypothetical protein [Staphylococcus pseudintermedius]